MAALYYRDRYVIDRGLNEEDLAKLVECLKMPEVLEIIGDAWNDGIEICKEAVAGKSGNIRREIEVLLQSANTKSQQE